MKVDDFLARLDQVRQNGSGWLARCPAHDDHSPSLSIAEGDDGRILMTCHAGCDVERIVSAVGLTTGDLFAARNLTPTSGCTLADYADAKRLPIDFLKSVGVTQHTYQGAPAVRIPYRQADGSDGPVQFRVRLNKSASGDDRFKWRAGSKTCLYGLWRLELAREAGYVVLVEGASDCHTLWHHGIPALGLPGAGNYKDSRDAEHFDSIDIIYVVVEPDSGGEAVKKWLATSRIRERVHLIDLGDAKDPSELHVADPPQFMERWQTAIRRAVPWTHHEAEQADAERRDAWEQCKELAHEPRILDRFADKLKQTRYAGDTRIPALLYIVLTSRRLDRPVSAVVKGPSSGGKSYSVERTLEYFNDAAYYALTGMSERALAYSDEPLSHRILVIYEAAGAAGDMQSYLLRSLLSEGRIRYETIEKTSDGIKPRLIEREGPTGVILTTTAVRLHPENETRLLSLTVEDTQEQTRLVLRALASGSVEREDFAPWHALQTWLDHAERRVTIPFAKELAESIPPVAVRLRRDFEAVLNLIRAHAILHQATREQDADGRIVASIDDYVVIRELVADLVSAGVEATVPATIRETVAVVASLTKDGAESASIVQIAKRLNLDKGAASRRVATAREVGYLVNLEDKRGKPARIVIGSALPDDLDILPTPDRLRGMCPGISSESLQHCNTTQESASTSRNSVAVADATLVQQSTPPASVANNTLQQSTPDATLFRHPQAENEECCSVAEMFGGIQEHTSPLPTDDDHCTQCGATLYTSQPGGLCRTCSERLTA